MDDPSLIAGLSSSIFFFFFCIYLCYGYISPGGGGGGDFHMKGAGMLVGNFELNL